jgi:hypothetical protein
VPTQPKQNQNLRKGKGKERKKEDRRKGKRCRRRSVYKSLKKKAGMTKKRQERWLKRKT